MDEEISNAFARYPEGPRAALMILRDRILTLAEKTPGVGPVSEMLKWGQPAYLTSASKSGTTIRLGLSKSGVPAIFTHCQSSVIAEFRDMWPSEFVYDGGRAVYVDDPQDPRLDQLFTTALTYHLRKVAR